MAVPTSPPHVSCGFPLSVLLRPADSKYLCGACGQLLRAAVQAPCGHRFCEGCHGRLVKRPEQWLCPSCQEEGTHEEELYSSPNNQCFPDRATRREVDQLAAHCPNAGCTWSGAVGDYDAHEPECAERPVACPGCGASLHHRELGDHAELSCPARSAPCRHCKAPCTALELPEHDLICPKIPVTCPACGKRKIPRDKLPSHETSCPRVERPCRYADLGCNFQAGNDRLLAHEYSAAASHVAMLRVLLLQLRSFPLPPAASASSSSPSGAASAPEAACSGGGGDAGAAAEADPAVHRRLSELQRRLRRLETMMPAKLAKRLHGGAPAANDGQPGAEAGADSLACTSSAAASSSSSSSPSEAEALPSALEERCARLENTVCSLEAALVVLDREVERRSADVGSALEQRRVERAALAAITGKLHAMERKLALREVALADTTLRLTALELSSQDGTFMWRIGDVRRRRGDAVAGRQLAVYSPAFFTSRYGYKMCLRLYPNGDGAGKGTHLSLFFVLMRGDHDATLRWPFRQKVTLTLLDQGPRRAHVIDAFRPDPASTSFQRPASDLNVASGCPLFCPLARLSAAGQTYVRDDTLFIKCAVDTTDL